MALKIKDTVKGLPIKTGTDVLKDKNYTIQQIDDGSTSNVPTNTAIVNPVAKPKVTNGNSIVKEKEIPTLPTANAKASVVEESTPYESALGEIGKVESPTTNPTTTYSSLLGEKRSVDNSYYDLLKNQSYKALQDKELQANAAKQQALKYMQNSINANGYGGQYGVSESAQLGANNQYRNTVANARSDYENALLSIAQQKKAEQDAIDSEYDNRRYQLGLADLERQNQLADTESERTYQQALYDKQLADTRQDATTQYERQLDYAKQQAALNEEITDKQNVYDNVVEEFGALDDNGASLSDYKQMLQDYGLMDANGKFISDVVTDSELKLIQRKYNNYVQLEAERQKYAEYTKIGEKIDTHDKGNLSVYEYNKNGSMSNVSGYWYSGEIDKLNTYISNGNDADGQAIKVTNHNENVIYLTYKNGIYYSINKTQYDKIKSENDGKYLDVTNKNGVQVKK